MDKVYTTPCSEMATIVPSSSHMGRLGGTIEGEATFAQRLENELSQLEQQVGRCGSAKV